MRSEARAASMAVLPPPMTATRRPRGDLPPEGRVLQEGDPRQHGRVLLPLDAHGPPLPGADGQDHRAVIPAQLLQLDVPAQAHPGLQGHPQAQHGLDLPVQGLLRQAVVGDAVAQHAAGLLLRLEHGDGHPLAGQVVGGRQPGGAAAHHRRPAAAARGQQRVVALRRGQVQVGHEALQPVDPHRLVHQVAPAGLLAGARADAAAHRGEGVVLLDQPQRLGVAAVGDETHVALHVDPGRAGLGAGRLAVAVMAGQQQLQGHAAGGVDVRPVGDHPHPLAHPGGAGRDEPLGPLHPHDADPAGAVGLQARVVAQGGDLDPVLSGHLQDGLLR